MAAARPLIHARPAPGAGVRVHLPFPLVFAGLLALVSLIPYGLAYAVAPAGHHFAGFFFIADDATTYLAKMRQGAEGSWTWNDPYTSEAHAGVFLFAFYLLAGHIAALLHLPLIVMYHVAAVAGAFALVYAIDRLAGSALPAGDRRLGTVLAVLGSGLGFVVQALGDPSVLGVRLQALDLHLPELSGWYSILAIPHFAWATALIVFSVLGLRAIAQEPSPRRVLATGAALLGLAAIHPQMVAVIFLVWLAARIVLWTWQQRPAWGAVAAEALAFAIPGPLLAYNAWILYRDPTIAAWASQWRHQAPDPLSLFLSLGLPLAAATVAIVAGWRRRDRVTAVLLVWPPLVIVLLYLPNIANIQRRLLDAVYVPIGLLAAVGLRIVLERLPPRRRRFARRLLVVLCCFSSVLVLAIALRFASGAFPDIYLTDAQWQAMTWLSAHHQAGDRALSSPQVGLFLPADSGVSVYVGHYSETLDYFAKIRQANAILQPATTPAQFDAFAHANGITLLYWGPDERKGRDFDPARQPSLDRIYDGGGVQLYRVTPRR
ncbi:MAG TPA: hypothetical protein VET65_04290 [Candidatus Limnocylindrales bacterium]|nr:hypothetical protein [Candidatus Limnocylindrales bacterium]